MFRRTLLASTVIVFVAASCAGDDTSEPEVLLEFEDASPGSIVGLIAVDVPDGRTAQWIDRIDGTIHRIDIDEPAEPETLATIPVGTDGEQRGLLGQVIIDGRRFASWTQPADAAGDFEIVVGEVIDGRAGDIVWSGGSAGGGAIGGTLDSIDGQILLGLGRNTEWDAETEVGGAILQIDPTGPPTQPGVARNVGYTNPWAFRVTETEEIWFADNAAGPDPDDPTVDDVERIGRVDRPSDRNAAPRISGPGRAPTSMAELPDGRIGICGFLDNELRAYEIVDIDSGPNFGERAGLERAGTIMPCNLGVAVFDDGTIVTIAQGSTGETLQILRP